MKKAGHFGYRWVAFLVLGVIAWLVNDWALEQPGVYIFSLQLICLVMIAISDVSQFVRGKLKFRAADENHVKLLEVVSFQLFLAVYSVIIAIVMIINLSSDMTQFFMSPLGLWLVFLPVMIAAYLITSAQQRNR